MAKAASAQTARVAPARAGRVAPARQAPPASKIERRAEQRDLASLVAWLRSGQPGELPFRRTLEHRVRGDLSAVEAYRGERARRVADAVDARAFAIGTVVGFADDRPALDEVAHEVAHVVQMCGPAPRRWSAVHPIGTVPWDNPYEVAARSPIALAEQARGPRAPVALYRAQKKQEPRTANEDALVQLMQHPDWKVQRFEGDQKRFADKQDRAYQPQYELTSPRPFTAEDLRTNGFAGVDLGVVTDFLEQLFAGDARRTFDVDGMRVTVAKVQFEKPPDTAHYVFLGNLAREDLAEVWAIPGRIGNEVTEANKILLAYRNILEGLLADPNVNDNVKAALRLVAGSLQAALALVAQSDKRVATEERQVRHSFIVAVADNYTDIDDLHRDVVASDLFRQDTTVDEDSEASFERIKGNIVERFFVAHYEQAKWSKIDRPKKGTREPVQPIFGERSGRRYLKSPYLQKVRMGDGVLVTTDDALEDSLNYGIAEIKAYTAGPKKENVEQMDDYARIITIPVVGYFRVKVGKKKPRMEKQVFTSVTYLVSDKTASVVTAWTVALDEHLGKLYTYGSKDKRVADLATLTVDVRLAEYAKAIASLKTENKKKVKGKKRSALVGITEVEEAIKAASADEEKAKPDTERLPAVVKIEDALIQAVADSYPAIEELHAAVLEDDRVFGGPIAKLAGDVLTTWMAKYAGGRTLDASLEAPLSGQRRAVRPIFVLEDPAKITGTWGKSLLAGQVDLVIVDDRIIVDQTAATGAPEQADVDMANDLKVLRPASIFLVTTAAFGPRLHPRTLAKLEYQFAPDAAEALTTPWQTKLSEIFGKELDPSKVFMSPDPTAPKAFVLRFSLNPEFEAKVEDASTLEPAITVSTKHPGITVEKASVKLTQVRKAEIASGSITFSIANESTRGLVASEQPQTKPIEPAEPATRTKGKAKPIHGRIQNKLSGLKSKLDSLLKRVRTDVKLIDGGIEAMLQITSGPSGIPKVDLDDAEVRIAMTGKELTPKISGKIGVSVAGGKIKGSIEAKWDKKQGLVIVGTAKIENLIDGLAPATATITYVAGTGEKPESLELALKGAKFQKRLKGVELTGTADIKYDSTDGTFSGAGSLTAALGSFGTASGDVKIEKNVLSEASIKYVSRDLRYPAKGEPRISGKIDGEVTYKAGKIKGSIGGKDIRLNVPALKKLSPDPIRLEALVKVDEDGTLSGAIDLLSPIQLGKHFRIESLHAGIDQHGKIDTRFAVEIVNIPILKGKANTRILCAINDRGFEVVEANLAWAFGTKEKTRFWGTFRVDYKKPAFVIHADLGVKLKEGMFAEGKLTYNSETGDVDTELTLPHIWLINTPRKDHTLFELVKQIGIVQIPLIVGLYIDVGFRLVFSTKFQIGARPRIKLQKFNLHDFTFKGASAEVTLDGDGFEAILAAVPRLGIGAFLFHPKILRGGGGIEVPIEGIARLKPTADTKVHFRYEPATEDGDAKVSAGAKLGLRLTFKIDGAIRPFAEFVVLDGLYSLPTKPPWRGAPLISFPLLPERELFTFEVNFGDPVETTTDAKMPEKSQPAKDDPSRKSMAGKQEAGGKQVDASKPAPEQKATEKPEAKGEEEGFNIIKLVDGIVGDGEFKPIWEVIKEVAEVIEAIVNFIGKIVRTIKSWFSSAYDALLRFLRGLKANGYRLFKYLMTLLKDVMNPTVFNIVEPILEMLAEKEDKFFDLIEGGMPSGVLGWLKWVFQLLGAVFSLAWDGPIAIGKSIYRLIGAMIDLASAAVSAMKRFIGLWVTEGWLGARENRYYVGSETLGLTYDFWAPDEWKAFGIGHEPDEDWPVYEISSAPAAAIWGALSFVGAPKSSHSNYWDEATDH